MPNGNPYGAGPTIGGGDARQRRLLQVSQGFLNQGPAGAGAGPRTRPSMYPDVQGFASTPVGRMLMRNILERMRGAPGQGVGRRQPGGLTMSTRSPTESRR